MENKINIAELLKNCPKGMELDCTMYNKVTLLDVDEREDILFPIKVCREDGYSELLTKYGQYEDKDFAKCIIFPKGKTTWEGFQQPFNDGDIIFEDRFHSICIFKKEGSIKGTIDYYCGISFGRFHVKNEKNIDEHFGDISDYRLATEEEKQKLFQAIKDYGYKWNTETKTLEKLIKPKFKVRDRIKDKYVNKGDCASEWKIINVNNDSYTVDCSQKIFFENQDNYELIINNQPKFNVGDRIKHKDSGVYCTLGEYVESFKGYITNIGLVIRYDDIDNWELYPLPNKFDVTTLKPFEKVLVRYGSFSKWNTGIFSHTVKSDNKLYFIVNSQYWEQCIPYEGNEHLRGTTDACSDYFKTWE